MKTTETTDADIRRIRITRRCGAESIAEVPEQFARLTKAYLCPGCRTIFTIREVDGKWKIARVSVGGACAA